MKNPLRKRWIRELRGDKGKHIALALFLILTIGFTSGFIIADDSMKLAYDESFEKYNIEDGNFTLATKMPKEIKEDLEDENISVTKQFYKDETIKGKGLGKDKTIRLFKPRDTVNKVCLMDGRLPKTRGEIAIDRLFAENNGLAIGDEIKVAGKKFTITGMVALPDYSCLFESNTDMMFNASKFTVSIVTTKDFDRISDKNLVYQYVWKDREGKKVSDKKIEDILKDSMLLTGFVKVEDNQAIQFTGDDMGSDRAMMLVMLYVVIVIMAFVFGITTKSLVEQEAQTIGTLKASGLTKGELLRHYMKLPIMLLLISAIVGNIIGYTWMKEICVDMYYHSYSLTTYKTIWSSTALAQTTLVPLAIVVVVTFLMLTGLLSLPPLQFLRKELSRKKKKRAARLPNWSFVRRFRLRVILQNRMAYLVLVVGVLLASVLLIFGTCMMPLMDHFSELVKDSQIAKYQYVLKAPAETDIKGAEKYCITQLRINDREDITCYGLKKDSSYVDDISLPEKKKEVLVSDGFAEKYQLSEGDKLKLESSYENKKYEFTIAGTYDYPATLSIFMSRENWNKVFDHKKAYFNGYFSEKNLKDVDDSLIASKITLSDLTTISDQLEDSFGAIMPLFQGFAIVIYVLLLYLLAKVIVDKNKQPISMLKILGYTSKEAGRLYNSATAIIVIVSLLVVTPISERIMKVLYYTFMKEINGWLPYYIEPRIYAIIPIAGIVCYFLIHLILSRKVSRIKLATALKSME